MKMIKIKLLIIGFLHLALTHTAQVDLSGWVNTETADFLNAQGGTQLSPDLEAIIKEAEANSSAPYLTTEAIFAFQHLVSGYQLTDRENTLMSSMFMTIDIINAFQDFLSQISDDNATPASPETVASFIVWSAGRALANNKNALDMLKEDLLNAGKLDAGLAKGIVQHLSQRLIQKMSNKSVEEVRATNAGLAVIDRVVTGKTTFLDRCYVKIVKALTKATDWIRGLFGKKSIRDNFDLSIMDILLDQTSALSALDYAVTLSKDAQDTLTPEIERLESNKIETPQWTEVNSITLDNKIVPEIVDTFSITTCVSTIMINGHTETIKTYVTQRTSDVVSGTEEKPFASVTQSIETSEGLFTKSYKVTGDTAQDAFNTAKTITENSIIALQSEQGDLTSEVNLLEKFEIELIKTGKIVAEDCTQATLEALDADNEKAELIATVTKTVFELTPHITLLQALDLIKLEAEQSTPDSLIISQDTIDLAVKMATLFQPNVDILTTIETMTGDETSKIDAAIHLKKQDVAKAIFDTYALTNLVDAKGNYKFNINELAKDDIMVNAAKVRLNDLLGKASLNDRKTINKLLADIATAVANRPVQHTPEEQAIYDKLTSQLNVLEEEGHVSVILDWAQKLSADDYALIESEIDVAVFKNSLTHTYILDMSDFTLEQLVELKKIFNDFITASEDFGYGAVLPTPALAQKYQDILIKSGINSPDQQQLLLNDVAVVENELLKNLTDEYNRQTNKKAWIDSLINNGSYEFYALSNESKINFINDLIDLSQQERDSYIAAALQNGIDQATTPDKLLALQKETFAKNDMLLQALQDKIKNVLTDHYKYLSPLDQYNFKRSLLDPKDFTDYSRAFKTLSFADQQAISSSFNIASSELMAFQKAFLADKIFYAKTFDEISTLKRDIKSFNDKTPNYFTNNDIAGKHGFIVIGDAIIAQIQNLIEQTIKTGAAINDASSVSSKDYFKTTLLNIKSSSNYATAFRELPLIAQHELAQLFGVDQDTQFKEFQKSIFLDEVGVATSPTELATLQHIAQTLGFDAADINAVTARLNKAVASGVAAEEPTARNISLDPNAIITDENTAGGNAGKIPTPTPNDVQQDFANQNLSPEYFHNSGESEEERRAHEEEYEAEQIAEKTEAAAQERAAKEAIDHER